MPTQIRFPFLNHLNTKKQYPLIEGVLESDNTFVGTINKKTFYGTYACCVGRTCGVRRSAWQEGACHRVYRWTLIESSAILGVILTVL